MSLFDSVISTAGERFGLGDKSGTLLSALLSLMTDQNRGGFGGFLDLFSKAGLGDTVSSWIGTGANADLSDEQVESALGNDTITSIANQAGVNATTAKSALGYMIPSVVDKLTPDGVVPQESDMLSKIGNFLSGWGGAAAGAALGAVGAVGAVAGGAAGAVGSLAGGAADKVGDVAGAGVDAGKKVVGAVGDTLGGAANMVGGAVGDVTGGGGGILKWLLPLILLGLALLLGYWMCGKAGAPTTGNMNTNVNKPAMNSNMNSNANANANAAPVATQTETELTLPDGTKIKAFAGGIEDQLIKFIQSDEYKTGTEETLKSKWFNFDDLTFKFGTTQLDEKSNRQLGNIKAILKAFPDVKLKIGSYADKKGDDAGNLKLSQRRADAVKAALGNAAQVPQAEGYGEKFATVEESASDEARAVDRKTAVRLLKGDLKVEANTTTKPADANAKPADANAKPAMANTNAASMNANAKPANAK